MFLLGLTGSIGMGKSTTAEMFAELGCAIWDADAAVHRLYSRGGAAVAEFAAALPDAIEDGQVSRSRLKTMIAASPDVLKKVEAIVHPLVAQDRAAFIAEAQTDIVVLDIPLLFETGADKMMDATATVLTSDHEQERRVMERGTMTSEHFEMIRAKQIPATEKAKRADYVIRTDTLDHARQQVQVVVLEIRGQLANA